MSGGHGHSHAGRRSRPAVLALADGRVFRGEGFGAEGEAVGEVVFNTSMTGYQEILTDPSYYGQIVTMTYPMIGNTGVNDADVESGRPSLSGFVVREYMDHPSNWRMNRSLEDDLKSNGIVGIHGIDTRALTRHIRDKGAQTGIIATNGADEADLVRRAKAAPGLVGRDLVQHVTCREPYDWTDGTGGAWAASDSPLPTPHSLPKIVVYDFGVKFNILRRLVDTGWSVTVVPAGTASKAVLAMNPDAILLSNGPGDPEAVEYAVRSARELVGRKPIFGICLGHQILGLALGGKTYKLKFGHHGGNQPVMDLATGKVEITAQNHGFAVDVDSIGGEMELTHINLNDRTVEGMRHRSLPILSVQYHPEASPGPRDAGYLFDRFKEMAVHAT